MENGVISLLSSLLFSNSTLPQLLSQISQANLLGALGEFYARKMQSSLGTQLLRAEPARCKAAGGLIFLSQSVDGVRVSWSKKARQAQAVIVMVHTSPCDGEGAYHPPTGQVPRQALPGASLCHNYSKTGAVSWKEGQPVAVAAQ